MNELYLAIQNYLNTTPVEVLGAHLLLAVGWVPIFGVLVWGFTEVWLDRKQTQFWHKLNWILWEVNVPQDAIQTPMGMTNFFTTIAGSKTAITWKEKWTWGKFQPYFTFELVSNGGEIKFYIRAQDKYKDLVEASFYAQYPEAQMLIVEDYVDQVPSDYPNEEYDLFGSEMVLSKPSYLPIKTWDLFEHQGEKDQRFKDPILPFIENLGTMKPGEHFWIQILCMPPDEQDWIKAGNEYINKIYGKEEPKKSKGFLSEAIGWIPQELASQALGMGSAGAEEKSQENWAMFKITPREKEQIDAVNRKIASLGWLSKIRIVYAGKKDIFRKGTIASMMKGLFHQFGHQGMNKFGMFIPSTPKDDYFYMEWQMPAKQRKLIKMYKNRLFGAGSTPYILNCEELATLFHFPAADARTPILTSIGARRGEAPSELEFAASDAPTLTNLDRVSADVQAAAGVTILKTLPEPGPLTVPTPLAPSRTENISVPSEQAASQAIVPAQEYLVNITSHSVSQPVTEISADEFMPRAGMPAPLPPGLDLSDQPLDQSSGPDNLPV